MLPAKTKQRRAKKKLSLPPSLESTQQAVKMLAKEMHSDVNGGNDEDMKEVTQRYNQIKQEVANQTHIGFVLDDSGSMNSKKHLAISSYNALLQSQASLRGNPTFSLSTFKQTGQVMPLHQASLLTQRGFPCSGNTPLYDTIAETILRIERECSNDVVVVIITDGRENCSREWRDPSRLAQLVQAKQNLGWQFIYCSSSWSAIRDGLKIGIPERCISNFQDMPMLFQTVGGLLTSYRRGEIKQITFSE
jgi:Mg-chelatase subunit ChlD